MKDQVISHCKNCGDIVEKNFCPNCGQERRDLDVSFKEIFSELLNETFSFDSKLFKTIKILFLKPGQLSTEYLAGKRVKYITPFRLYLIISILFFVVLNFKNFVLPDIKLAYNEIKTYGILPDSTRAKEKFSIEEPKKIPEETSGILKLQVRNSEIETIAEQEFIRKAINTFQNCLFFLLPIGALILQFLFFRRRKRYIEHLILMTHVQSAIFLVLILNILIDFSVFNWISFLYLYYFFVHSLIVFYNQKIGIVILKLQLFFSMYFFVFFIIGIIALIVPAFIWYYVS